MTRAGNIIGKNIAKLRTERGLSQAELAARCQRLGWDLSRDVLARIELRIRTVTDQEIAVISTALEVEVGILFPEELVKAVLQSIR